MEIVGGQEQRQSRKHESGAKIASLRSTKALGKKLRQPALRIIVTDNEEPCQKKGEVSGYSRLARTVSTLCQEKLSQGFGSENKNQKTLS